MTSSPLTHDTELKNWQRKRLLCRFGIHSWRVIKRQLSNREFEPPVILTKNCRHCHANKREIKEFGYRIPKHEL